MRKKGNSRFGMNFDKKVLLDRHRGVFIYRMLC